MAKLIKKKKQLMEEAQETDVLDAELEESVEDTSESTETPLEDNTEEETKPKTIRDITDLKRPFTMLYSGVEDEKNFHLLYDLGIRDFLISYQYVQRKRMDMEKYTSMGIKFFVDSGAFTYLTNSEYEDWSVEDWEKQIKRYLNWARKHKDIIFAIASLDIERLVGGEQVQKWNEQYFEPFMIETGVPVCFVYHEDETYLDWEHYCQRYPYVGISWATNSYEDGVKTGTEMLRTAEKYNTVVHGMAMTQTSVLPKLPFYTVDSTTWLVGLQYGEVNYWNGKKMQRLKKDVWKGSMLERLVEEFSDYGIDKEGLIEEDKEQLIKVNVLAFIQAEEYIRDRAKSRMYWLKPPKKERTEADLETLEYPSAEWCDDSDLQDNWEEFAQSFNISTEDPDEALDCIIDLTCLMNWDNPDYEEFIEGVYTEELIKELHDRWVNRVVSSKEERVADLQDFYKRTLLGQDTKLLYLGTNFDKIVREREDREYITDEEYEEVDMSEMELANKLSKYLPERKEGEEAPEISELDDEIFRQEDIIPVRDANGRFLKGQKKVLKPKKLYSAKYPKMACDTCYGAQKCPEYKAGYVCAYNKMFNRFDTRDMTDVIQGMQGIVDFSMQRLQRGMMFEMMDGGIADPIVTSMMDQTMRYLDQLRTMYEYGSAEVLRQTKVIHADGREETTTQVSNPQSGGILEKIFGNMTSTPDEPKQEEPKQEEPKKDEVIIDVEPKERD